MGKGSLNVSTLVLCTEAERAAITLHHHPQGLRQMTKLGYPSDSPPRLTALATAGREAYTAAGRTATQLRRLQAEGRELALVLYALHKRARATMRAIELIEDIDISVEAVCIRSSLNLHSPRLQAGMVAARRLADTLHRPDTPLASVTGIPELRAAATALTERARALIARIQHAKAERRRCTRELDDIKAKLRHALRHLREAWRAVQLQGTPLPDLKFELVRHKNTRRTSSRR